MDCLDIEFRYIDEDTENLLSFFDCGHEGINNFLIESASEYDGTGLGTTHLAINNQQILGYYTLRNSSLLYHVKQDSFIRGLLSTEIYIFAVDKRFQGQQYTTNINISDFILKHAISTIYDNNLYSASKFIILNSVNKAINFYRRNKFIAFDTYMQFVYDDHGIPQNCTPMYKRIY